MVSYRRVLLTSCLALLLVPGLALPGSLTVNPQSATIGAYGLEVTVGSNCSSPTSLSVSAPPAQIEGSFEACETLLAQGIEVMGTGVTFRSGETVQLGEGFSVASGVNFTVEIVPALSSFAALGSSSPIAETSYFATFYLRLDDLSLTAGDAIESLAAYSAAGESLFVLTVRKNPGGQNSLHLAARDNGGGMVQMIAGQELPLASGWNKIDVEWISGAGTGAFRVGINDATPSGLNGLVNSAGLVETIRLGAIGGSVSTSAGRIQFDGFDSWR